MINIKFEAMKEKIEKILKFHEVDYKLLDSCTTELLDLYNVVESYIKCWNCKQFEQTGTNTMGNEVGNCKLNE